MNMRAIVLLFCSVMSAYGAHDVFVITMPEVAKTQQMFFAQEQKNVQMLKIKQSGLLVSIAGFLTYSALYPEQVIPNPISKVAESGSSGKAVALALGVAALGAYLMKRAAEAVVVNIMVSQARECYYGNTLTLAECMYKTHFIIDANATALPYKLLHNKELSRSALLFDSGMLTIVNDGTVIDIGEQCVSSYNTFARDVMRVAGFMYYFVDKYKDMTGLQLLTGKIGSMASQLIAVTNAQGQALKKAIEDKKNNGTVTVKVSAIVHDLFDEITNAANNFALIEKAFDSI